MYFSFYSIPEVRELDRKETYATYMKVSRAVRLPRKRAWLCLLSFTICIFLGGVAVEFGVAGGMLVAVMLAAFSIIWLLGNLYILNRVMHPKLTEISDYAKS